MRFPVKEAATCLGMVVTLGLAACAPSGQPVSGSTPPPQPAEQAPSSTTTPAEVPGPTAQPAPDASQPAPLPTDSLSAPVAMPTQSVLASSEGEITGARVEVLELNRSSGDTVNLKFVLVNDADKSFSFANYLGNSGIGSDYRSVGGVHLVDPAGKKKYLVVRDAETNCMCSREVQDAGTKTRVNLWAKFPAPPADVKTVSIVIPHFGPMDDVPISQ